MAWLRRLRARVRYRHFDADVRREIDAHGAMMEADLRAAGRSGDEARVEAVRTLGNVTLSREDARRVWIAPWLEGVAQDLRYGMRSLTRSPGFTATALLTLTLGIALNTSFFTLASGLFLKPWPLPDPGRVVTIVSRGAQVGFSASTSPAEFRFLRDNARTVELVAIEESSARLGAGAEAARVDVRHVSGNYFDAQPRRRAARVRCR